jgi:hypothetical protein
MRLLSPSSRLVLATVVVALLALAFTGTGSPSTGSGGTSPSQPGVALGSNADSSIAIASGDLATATHAAQPPTTNPISGSTPRPTPRPTIRATPKPVACTPTDQNQYVYNPARLSVQAACIRVTGIVQAVRKEADGDFHILVALDPRYVYLLTPANQGEELGDLVVEPVCVRTVTQLDAEAICASDPDPLPPPYPVVGERVWMEGRYVFDLDHGGWAELHPLYRWGNA